VATDNGTLYDESFSIEAYTKYEYRFSTYNKLKTSYRLTLTEKESGRYKHHLEITLENDIVKDRIFINTSFLWDYIDHVQPANGITPLQSDYQIIVGGGLKF